MQPIAETSVLDGPRVISRRTFLKGSAAGVGLAAAGPILLRTAGFAAPPPVGVHLAYGANPGNQMSLLWSTAEPVDGLVAELGPTAALGQTVPVSTATAPGVSTLYHRALASSLLPDSTYHYRLAHNGAELRGTFRTAPESRTPFRFAAFGDMGVSAGAAAIVARIQQANPQLCFVVGDLCYADLQGGTGAPLPQDPAIWDTWLAQITPSSAAIPWMTTVGNHEMERGNGELGYDGYLARFALPNNGPENAPVAYSFMHGNVGFVALDGNDASFEIARNRGYVGSAQDQWLDATLTSLRASAAIDFIVVGFHNCMYCTNAVHASDGGNRTRWESIFDRHSVDVVFNGHNHCYERTHPMRAGAVVDEVAAGGAVNSTAGTTYMTVGGGGQAEYPTSTHPASYVVMDGGLRVPELAPWSAGRYMAHSLVIADVDPGDDTTPASMTLTAMAKDGHVVETVTLERR